MILISKRKSLKNCVYFPSKRIHICSDKSKDEQFFPYIAYMLQKNINKGFIHRGKTVVLIKISNDKVTLKQIEIPEHIKDDIEQIKLYIETNIGEYYEYLGKENEIRTKITLQKENKILLVAIISFIITGMIGGFFYYKHKKEEKIKKLMMMQQQRKKPVSIPLTVQKKIKSYISREVLKNTAQIINELPQFQKVDKIAFTGYKPIIKQGAIVSIDGMMRYQISSIYPVKNSIKSGDFFTYSKTKTITGRKNINIKWGDMNICGQYILENGGDLINYGDNFVKISFKTNNYFNFKNIAEFLYNKRCLFYFEGYSLSKNSYNLNFVLWEENVRKH